MPLHVDVRDRALAPQPRARGIEARLVRVGRRVGEDSGGFLDGQIHVALSRSCAATTCRDAPPTFSGQRPRRTGSSFSALFRFDRVRTGSPISSIVGYVRQQLLEEHPPLEPRQVHAEAVVLGDAERQMRVRLAVDVEPLRVVEDRFVAVGRRVVHRHLVAGLDLDVAQLGVGGRGATEVVQRVGPPQDLLDGAVDQCRVGAQLGQLLGMVEQRQQSRREHRLGRVVAGGDELHEERTEVDLAHERAAELGTEDQRREIFAGLFLRGDAPRTRSRTSPSP